MKNPPPVALHVHISIHGVLTRPLPRTVARFDTKCIPNRFRLECFPASPGYHGLLELGYEHSPLSQNAGEAAEEPYLPRAHRALSNLKAWLHGTHRRASRAHLQRYLAEFVFRHNRRGNPHAAFQT